MARNIYIAIFALVFILGFIFSGYATATSTVNITYPLNGTDPGNWIGTTSIQSVSFDSNNNGAYVVGGIGVDTCNWYIVLSEKTSP